MIKNIIINYMKIYNKFQKKMNFNNNILKFLKNVKNCMIIYKKMKKYMKKILIIFHNNMHH